MTEALFIKSKRCIAERLVWQETRYIDLEVGANVCNNIGDKFKSSLILDLLHFMCPTF